MKRRCSGSAIRLVSGLLEARRCDDIVPPRPASKFALAGLAYERAVAKSLFNSGAAVQHNPAFYFEDANGPGYCVPDIILRYHGHTFVVECKLTWKPEALEKLLGLYIPVIAQALRLAQPPVPLVIAKNLTDDSPIPALSLEDALCQEPKTYLLHWLGRGAFPLI